MQDPIYVVKKIQTVRLVPWMGVER